MLILLSCAKTMSDVSKVKTPLTTFPRFRKEAAEVALQMSQFSVGELERLLRVNAKIAVENYKRYQDFHSEATRELPALLAYTGIVFKRLSPKDFSDEDFRYAQDHLRLTSFCYGLLRPLDVIRPYRLEGDVRLPEPGTRTMFEYWKPVLTDLFIEDIKKACQVMNEGGVILYPTDTVWGIGCDATNEEAVRRVYEIKKRADSKAMLVLVDSPVKVDFYVQDVPDVAWDLIEVADKPLTIIYSGARNLASNLLAEDGSVGIRVTNEDFSRRLCQQFRKAIVSTSANVSGQPGAANFSEISDEIKSAVDYIVGFRQDDMSRPRPSSIIKLEKGGVIKIIRE